MGFQDRTIAQYKIDAAGLEATIRGQNSIITQQTTALIGHEATINNQATRKRQIERCAGLPLHAQFVIDPCPKRMDGAGRRGRTSNVLQNFNLTAQRFTDIALRSGGGSVPRARERRHSIAVGATRFEIASQYYELGLTAIPTNCRERLEGKKKERLEVVSSTQSDFLLRGDLGRRLANNNLPASSAMVVRGSYELDTHDLALRRRDRNKPLPSVALDDISNNRISWGDVTKYNASNYFEWRRIRAEESARKMLSETVQSHLRHTAQDLKALDRYLKLHDLEKDRGSGNSLLHRLRAVSHHPSHAGLTKVTEDIAQRNKQVQKEFKSRIEIVIGLLEKWNKDLSKYTEATSSHETTGDTSGKKKRERSKRKADTDHPNADHEESSDEEVGPTPNASAQDGSTYTASNVSNGYGHTNRLAYEHASHGNDDNVLPQCEATENVVVEHGDSIDSQVGASQAQIEVPQPRKKTRRKTRPRKTIDQQETNGADPTKSDQHKAKASHEDGPGAGLQSSKWAQASGAKI
ncbi:hypothetical protein PMZ80_005634 [Knufia obscura]|nr:hypothetical protein PMZ80_005634 [Knufia obscura]